MTDTWANIWGWIIHNIPTVVAIVLALFEFTPIKVHPIRSILKWLGKHFNAEVKEDIGNVRSEVNGVKSEVSNLKNDFINMQTEMDLNEMDRIRWDILSFANSCRHGRLHTKDEFEHIIRLEEKYDKLLEKTNTTNGVFEEEYKYILEIYHKCQRDNSFL